APLRLEVAEIEGGVGVSAGGDVDYSRGGSSLELRQQEVGEKKIGQVVHGELQLQPLSGDLPPPGNDPRIVDQYVEAGVASADITGGLPDRKLGREVGGDHIGRYGSIR